jgi:ubiquinone/menaquinone biosynthesis C-methylase UbiE
MRADSRGLEAERLAGVESLDGYDWFHERHRAFPAIFEDRRHRRILDVAAGMGVIARRIRDQYPHELLVCNEAGAPCLKSLRALGLTTSSFDLDDPAVSFPFRDAAFDAVVATTVIEHLLHTEHFLKEIHRILDEAGRLYLCAPNYAGLAYLMPLLLNGRTFHDPLKPQSKYEFYGHVRYFTYRTLLELVPQFGFSADTAYVPLPAGSSRWRRLRERSRLAGAAARLCAEAAYRLSFRWASEPIICFGKARNARPLRKVILA